MTLQISIPAPDLSEYEDEDDFDEESRRAMWIEHANDHIDDLQGAFDMQVNEPRANIDEVAVNYVEVDGDEVVVHFEFEYSAYYGCKDMDGSDSDTGFVNGKIVGDRWVFDRFIPRVPLSPDEEL